jgi:hypothetical protein
MTKPKPPRQPPRRRFLQAESGFDIVQAMHTLFMRWFDGESCWDPWRVILKAAFALPMTKQEIAFFKTIVGDRDPPKKRVKELWVVVPTRRQGLDRELDRGLRADVSPSRSARRDLTSRPIARCCRR